MTDRSTAVIVGGGVAGLSAALNLAERGIDITLIEREPELGGNALTVCCKAVAGDCQLCGGCLLGDKVTAASRHSGIDIMLETTIRRVQRVGGRFVLRLGTNGDEQAVDADALVLATGFDHIDAHTKGPYGYGILPAVITGEDMERRITELGQNAYDDMGLEKVAFVQCVGSRDEHLGRGYCSQVCCRYAVRLARLLKSRIPGVDITIYKMDIQSSGRDMLPCWHAAQSEGIRIVAGLPAVIRRSDANPSRAAFIYDDILAEQVTQEDFDLVVLSTGIMPRREAPEVALQFGLNLDRFGFLAARADGSSTLVPGVFLAGTCQAPRSIAESIAHAQQAAELCYRYLDCEGDAT